MNCVAYRDHFSAYIEGNLAVSKHDLMQVHLDQCAQCAPQFAQFARAMDVMAEERRQPEADAQPLGDVMLAELGLPPRAPASRRWPLAGLWGRLPRPARFAAAAGLLAAAGLGFAATGVGQGA
ncbi:MAG: anti-sigma factor family protein, partial [Planctomycetota bacterium]